MNQFNPPPQETKILLQEANVAVGEVHAARIPPGAGGGVTAAGGNRGRKLPDTQPCGGIHPPSAQPLRDAYRHIWMLSDELCKLKIEHNHYRIAKPGTLGSCLWNSMYHTLNFHCLVASSTCLSLFLFGVYVLAGLAPGSGCSLAHHPHLNHLLSLPHLHSIKLLPHSIRTPAFHPLIVTSLFVPTCQCCLLANI